MLSEFLNLIEYFFNEEMTLSLGNIELLFTTVAGATPLTRIFGARERAKEVAKALTAALVAGYAKQLPHPETPAQQATRTMILLSD